MTFRYRHCRSLIAVIIIDYSNSLGCPLVVKALLIAAHFIPDAPSFNEYLLRAATNCTAHSYSPHASSTVCTALFRTAAFGTAAHSCAVLTDFAESHRPAGEYDNSPDGRHSTLARISFCRTTAGRSPTAQIHRFRYFVVAHVEYKGLFYRSTTPRHHYYY
jgi:hypothetical protein